MASILEPATRPQTELHPASAFDRAAGLPEVEDAWDFTVGEGPFPWTKLLLIGGLIGLGIGLPLIPSSDLILTTFGTIAGALGCPFHAVPTEVR